MDPNEPRHGLMHPRFTYTASAPGTYDAMDALDRYLVESTVERRLLYLVQLRASQLNGCAYCIDMHWKDLRALDETEQRLYSLDVWRECPWYTERERAALAWTEAVTLVATGHVSDAVYDQVRPHFNDAELADLTLAVATINAWNRLSIAARLTPGAYKPALAGAATT
jgi:AhpD family alkylhydroperoxidase